MGYWTNFTKRMNPSEPLYITTAGWHEQEPVLHQGFPDWHLHLTLKGEGVLFANGKKHLLSQGTLFLHPPDTPVEYYAVSKKWIAISITYNGAEAKALSDAFVGVSKTKDFFVLKGLLDDIYLLPKTRRQSIGKKLVRDLLLRLPEHIVAPVPPSEELKGALLGDAAAVAAVKQYVEAHLNERITVDDLCRVAGYKKTKLSAVFKEKTRSSLYRYVERRRLFRAAELLKRALHLSVEEIAELCGFSSLSYFDQRFRKAIHSSPLEFRKSFQERDQEK